MVLGMLTGAILLMIGILIGIKIRPEEEKIVEEYPTTFDGKYFSAKTAIREATRESDD